MLHESARAGDLLTISKLAGEKRCAWSESAQFQITLLVLCLKQFYSKQVGKLKDGSKA